MPRTTTATAAKVYRATSRAYDAVAEVFQESIREETTPRRLLLELEAGQTIWQEVRIAHLLATCSLGDIVNLMQDFNYGLIEQVATAFRRFSVLKLGKTYSSLTIADIAKHTTPIANDVSETATYLNRLISTGDLKAVILQRGTGSESWILQFDEERPSMSEAQQLQELKATEIRIEDLAARITESDQKMGLSKEYLEWCRKAEAKSKDETPGGFQDMMDEYMHDEDVMTDI